MQGINSILGHIAEGTISPETRRDSGPLFPCLIASEIRELSHQNESWSSRQEMDHAPVTRHWLPSHKPVQPTARVNSWDHTQSFVYAAGGTGGGRIHRETRGEKWITEYCSLVYH